MSESFSYDKLLKLLSIMQQMLVEANQENWQELNRLDSERRVLIDFDSEFIKSQHTVKGNESTKINSDENISSDSHSYVHPTGKGTEYEALSDQIRTLDRSIMKTVTEARKLSLDKNRGLAGQVKAKNGYAQTSAITSMMS